MPRSGVAGPYGSSVLNMSANWKIQQWPQGWKKSVFIPIPKQGNAKECSNYRTIALISHASKVTHVTIQNSKFSKPGFSNTWTMKFYMFKLVLEKAEEPEIKLPTSTGSSKKQENSRKKNIYFCFIDYAKVFDRVDHNKLWKILKEIITPDHLTCHLRNLYAG